MAEDIPVTKAGGAIPSRREVGYEAAWGRMGAPPFGAFARRVSWGAIIAGLVVGLVVELALAMLGLAVGLGSINPASSPGPMTGFGVGAGVWMAVTTFLALLAAGYTAGRLAGQPLQADGVLHGVVTWGLVTLLSTWLLTNLVGSVVSGALGVVGSALGVVGQGVTAIAPTAIGAVTKAGGTSAVSAEVERFLRQTGDPALQPEALQRRAAQAGQAASQAAGEAVTQPQNAAADIEAALARVVSQGQGVINQVDRQDAVNVIVARTGKTPAEAGQIVDQWVAQWQSLTGSVSQAAQNAGQTAAQVTESVSGTLGTIAGWSFFSMLLGGLAAAYGGSLGTPKTVPVTTAPTEGVPLSREH